MGTIRASTGRVHPGRDMEVAVGDLRGITGSGSDRAWLHARADAAHPFRRGLQMRRSFICTSDDQWFAKPRTQVLR